MKSEMHAAGFLLLFLFLFVFFSSSCSAGATRDRAEYTKKNFSVEISGSIDEKEIGAILHSRPDARDEEPRALVCFTYPKSLCDIITTVSAEGECNIRLGDIVTDAEGLDGLVVPFRPVFEMGEIYSVTVDGDGCDKVRICDEKCDLIYVFEQNSSVPTRIYGDFWGKKIDLILKNFSFDFDFG